MLRLSCSVGMPPPTPCQVWASSVVLMLLEALHVRMFLIYPDESLKIGLSVWVDDRKSLTHKIIVFFFFLKIEIYFLKEKGIWSRQFWPIHSWPGPSQVFQSSGCQFPCQKWILSWCRGACGCNFQVQFSFSRKRKRKKKVLPSFLLRNAFMWNLGKGV